MTTSGESAQSTFDLGPDDFLVYPRSVHVMRYQGRNDDGHRWWRLTCGSRPSSEAMREALHVDLESVALYEMAVCRRCVRQPASATSGRSGRSE